jgi:hypothetical protein
MSESLQIYVSFSKLKQKEEYVIDALFPEFFLNERNAPISPSLSIFLLLKIPEQSNESTCKTCYFIYHNKAMIIIIDNDAYIHT